MYIVTVINVLNIFMEHVFYLISLMIFGTKKTIDHFHFDPYNVFLAIATNISQRPVL